ncbi:ORF137 [Betabaculovirus altermyunipunctae]|uniref:ORF137 n=1 Tax=Betabaculovirus altermyunipunctae TaxID=3051996 RepID=A0A1S5YEA1_9BBAC|nr:ORF137 [Betabaculovirus altermyunipunctae]AQQ80404.1 ORF137 [Betabaculovirus altermyunipunctae]
MKRFIVVATLTLVACDETFMSTYEAFLLDGRGLCLGDCVAYKCVYKYNLAVAPCVVNTTIPARHYRTANNQQCLSNCGYFDGTSYQWCVLRSKSWDYCTRNIALTAVETVRTDNSYMTCGYTTCGHHNRFAYNWCGTIGTYWEYCDPDNTILLIDYPTYLRTECASPCELRGNDNVAYCYDTNYDWTRCYLNPDFRQELNRVAVALKNGYARGGNFTRHGYKKLDLYKVYAHRQSNPSEWDVERVTNLYVDNNPSVVLKPNVSFHDPKVTHNSTDPIHSYTLNPVPNHMYADQINLPLVVFALITKRTLRDTRAPRPFAAKINRHFQHMHGDQSADELGFIVDYTLGGPIARYNMFPESWRQRTKRLMLRNAIVAFLSNDANVHVKVTAVMVYLRAEQRRPTAVMMRVRFFDGGRLVNKFGERIRPAENSMENMYFDNSLDEAETVWV